MKVVNIVFGVLIALFAFFVPGWASMVVAAAAILAFLFSLGLAFDSMESENVWIHVLNVILAAVVLVALFAGVGTGSYWLVVPGILVAILAIASLF